MPDSYIHERIIIKQNIKDACGSRTCAWYRRINNADKPSILINEPQDLPAGGAVFTEVQGTMYGRVIEQPALWQNMGRIPVNIDRNTGFTATPTEIGLQKVGGYYGVCSWDYTVGIDDHLIDVDLNEYVVISAVSNTSQIFRRLGMEYIPKATP